jgi:hypothetical protein
MVWVNYNDLTATTGIMVSKGNDPQMAELFRFVKYYNLPRSLDSTEVCWRNPLQMKRLMGKSWKIHDI